MVNKDSDEVLLAVARDLQNLRDKYKEWTYCRNTNYSRYLVAITAFEDLTELLHQYGME